MFQKGAVGGGPPLPPPAPSFAPAAPPLLSASKPRSVLLDSIAKGLNLRKGVTNDRSAPILEVKPVARGGGGGGSPLLPPGRAPGVSRGLPIPHRASGSATEPSARAGPPSTMMGGGPRMPLMKSNSGVAGASRAMIAPGANSTISVRAPQLAPNKNKFEVLGDLQRPGSRTSPAILGGSRSQMAASPTPPMPPPKPGRSAASAPDEYCKCLYDYKAQNPDELCLVAGSVVKVLVKHPNHWWLGVLNGQEGLFPDNYVEAAAVPAVASAVAVAGAVPPMPPAAAAKPTQPGTAAKPSLPSTAKPTLLGTRNSPQPVAKKFTLANSFMLSAGKPEAQSPLSFSMEITPPAPIMAVKPPLVPAKSSSFVSTRKPAFDAANSVPVQMPRRHNQPSALTAQIQTQLIAKRLEQALSYGFG